MEHILPSSVLHDKSNIFGKMCFAACLLTLSMYLTICAHIFPHTLAYIAVFQILGRSWTFQWKWQSDETVAAYGITQLFQTLFPATFRFTVSLKWVTILLELTFHYFLESLLKRNVHFFLIFCLWVPHGEMQQSRSGFCVDFASPCKVTVSCS